MPKISIIMGAYNCQDTVCESIDSILAQTFTDWEFIICDDASTDETLTVLNRYKTNYPDKFVILHNENNMMLAGSLNRCLKVAKGKYIARMDADDLSEPTRLQKQYEYLENNPDMDLVGTFMQGFDDEKIFNEGISLLYDYFAISCRYSVFVNEGACPYSVGQVDEQRGFYG